MHGSRFTKFFPVCLVCNSRELGSDIGSPDWSIGLFFACFSSQISLFSILHFAALLLQVHFLGKFNLLDSV
jgi:hypothetical protein